MFDVNVTRSHFDERFAVFQAGRAESSRGREETPEIVSDFRIHIERLVDTIVSQAGQALEQAIAG